MVNQDLRRELLALREEDVRVRSELAAANQLGGPYVPRMEEVHVRNAARLQELIELHGWPAEDLAGEEGAKAAWFIVQHSVGNPALQRRALVLIQACVAEGRVPAWHGAYLEDRIAMQEGRPQRFGTQWLDESEDGLARPWRLAQPGQVNELRASVGLGPLAPIPAPGLPLPPQQRRSLEEAQQWWDTWLAGKGWRSPEPR